MTDLTATIQVKGLKEYQKALQRLERLSKDLKPVFRGILGVFRSRVGLEFSRGVDPAGQPWAEHSENYNRYRGGAKLPKPYQKLVDTGRLRNSFSGVITKDSLSFGTNVIYAPTHQFGDTARNIPARPFLPLSGLPGPWADDVDAIIDRAFKKALD